jgi:hypothetical protein
LEKGGKRSIRNLSGILAPPFGKRWKKVNKKPFWNFGSTFWKKVEKGGME